MIMKISWKFDEDLVWFRSGLYLGLGGCWEFLTGYLKEGVIFDIINHVGIWYGRYHDICWGFHENLTSFGWDIDMAAIIPYTLETKIM